MKELEKYIREHAAEFDTAEPAAGHEALALIADRRFALFFCYAVHILPPLIKNYIIQ